MTDKKKAAKTPQAFPEGFSGMSFEDALERFVRADPNEVARSLDRIKERGDEIKEASAERRVRLRDATRGPKKQFRL